MGLHLIATENIRDQFAESLIGMFHLCFLQGMGSNLKNKNKLIKQINKKVTIIHINRFFLE